MKFSCRAVLLATILIVPEASCSLVAGLGPKKEKTVNDNPSIVNAGDGGAPPSLQAVRVAVGMTQTCAIVTTAAPETADSGEVRCWGSNRDGELGSDSLRVFMSTKPLAVAGLPGAATALTCAKDYACAVTADHSFFGWGLVPMDPLVRRSVGVQLYQPSAMELSGEPIGRVATASVGATGGCYATLDGVLACWGAYARGVIQDGRLVLAGGIVTNADPFEGVAVGRAHACGIARRNGVRVVECWGANDHEQTGVLNEPPDNPGPARVNDPNPIGLASTSNVMQVAAGGDDSCARFEDGSVYCWGANDLEELGIVDPRDRSVPTLIALPARATDIAVGQTHACAVLETTNVWCWGDNSHFQLGSGPASSDVPSAPVVVQKVVGVTPDSLSKVRSIAAGGATTCATLDGDPFVWCWGQNDFGQAGQTPTAYVWYAAPVGW